MVNFPVLIRAIAVKFKVIKLKVVNFMVFVKAIVIIPLILPLVLNLVPTLILQLILRSFPILLFVFLLFFIVMLIF